MLSNVLVEKKDPEKGNYLLYSQTKNSTQIKGYFAFKVHHCSKHKLLNTEEIKTKNVYRISN